MKDDDVHIRRAREQWVWRGQQRPPFAAAPRPGQESVWDFPRPPALRPVHERLIVMRGATTVAATTRGYAAFETAHPPTYYFHPDDVEHHLLQPANGTTVCEWKGEARYFDVLGGPPMARAAWCYPSPFKGWEAIAGHLAFMPQGLVCQVGNERARPQPGGFYGGWITSRYAGPFKGEPGITG